MVIIKKMGFGHRIPLLLMKSAIAKGKAGRTVASLLHPIKKVGELPKSSEQILAGETGF